MHACLIPGGSPVGDAEIWRANLESLSAEDVAQLGQSLCVSERARAAQFHFERDRQRYVATRGLLRSLLGSITQQAPGAVDFEYGPHGKPALAGANGAISHIRFNLSHAGGWAMFVVARDRDVGIDLEAAARLDHDEDHLARFAAAVLTARELATWRQLPDAAARRAGLLRAWTRKEAYAKATGGGLFETLSRIEVALDAAEPKPSLTIAGRWMLHDLAAPDGFAASLAVDLRDV